MNTDKILDIPCDQIEDNPYQPRRTFDDTFIARMGESIKKNGVMQPIVVRKVDGKYFLVAGERRLRGSKLIGNKTIPCIVKNIDNKTAMVFSYIENTERESLNTIEKACGAADIADQFGDDGEASQYLGISGGLLSQYKKIASSADFIKNFVIRSSIKDSTAVYKLCALAEKNEASAASLIDKWRRDPASRENIRSQIEEAKEVAAKNSSIPQKKKVTRKGNTRKHIIIKNIERKGNLVILTDENEKTTTFTYSEEIEEKFRSIFDTN